MRVFCCIRGFILGESGLVFGLGKLTIHVWMSFGWNMLENKPGLNSSWKSVQFVLGYKGKKGCQFTPR